MLWVNLEVTVATETTAEATSPHCVDAIRSLDARPYDNAAVNATITICNRCDPVREKRSLRGVVGSILIAARCFTLTFVLVYSASPSASV